MTYDHWKTTNPADAELGSTCEDESEPMNDWDHHVGMASYALLADIENWTDLAREKTARKLLVKDTPEIVNAIEALLTQIHAMIHEGTPDETRRSLSLKLPEIR